jgi:uncharacterized YigZ family protein
VYKIPAKSFRTEETIKRSKFIASLAHADSEADAKAYISRVKNEFPDASHNCWAYVVGPPGDSSHVGMSDDGEPHGTAGKPMLTVLLHSGIGEIVAVVSRYFGGTKLGTGGLVRAYSDSVKTALAGLALKEKKEVITLIAIFDYARVAPIKQVIESMNAQITAEEYTANVAFTIEVPKNKETDFVRNLTNLTGGDIRITR